MLATTTNKPNKLIIEKWVINSLYKLTDGTIEYSSNFGKILSIKKIDNADMITCK